MNRMRALIEVNPEAAKKEIVAAFKMAKCHYQIAAAALDCKQHTLTRWARLLGIKLELEAMEARAMVEGWHHGRHGGAGYHKDPELRAKRARRTRKAYLRRNGRLA